MPGTIHHSLDRGIVQDDQLRRRTHTTLYDPIGRSFFLGAKVQL